MQRDTFHPRSVIPTQLRIKGMMMTDMCELSFKNQGSPWITARWEDNPTSVDSIIHFFLKEDLRIHI